MVEPVNNRNYYDYGRINPKVGTGVENGEKFSLNYDHTEKDSEKKEDEKTKLEADGVIAEFSGQSRAGDGGVGNDGSRIAGEKEDIDFAGTVERAKSFIGELVRTIRELFGNIRKSLLEFWNSDDNAQQEAADGVEMEDAIDVTQMSREIDGGSGIDTVEVEGTVERANYMTLPEMDSRKTEAEKYLENTQQMERYVKNSDLLTYYDRSGKIVKMNGSDKNRILHGDRGTSRGV